MDLVMFIERLDNTTHNILQAVKESTPEQLQVKQEGKWSILEILEHLYLTDKVIFTIISRPSETVHPASEIIGNAKLQQILVEQRSKAIRSPDLLQPKGEIQDLNRLIELFASQREAFKQDLLSSKIVIDNRVHKHPLLGEMTIIDWLNFTTHHTQRHTEQIKDIHHR